MRYEVHRLFRDAEGITHSEFSVCPNLVEAKAAANALSRKEGEVWITERANRQRYIDPPSNPLSAEQLAELRKQINKRGDAA